MPFPKLADIVQFALAGAVVVGVGATMAPTHTIGLRGETLRGLVGRYAPMSVIQIGAPVETRFNGPATFGHNTAYTMRTVDTQNNAYGTGDTYESFANINPAGTVVNGGAGSHWPANVRQPSPYNFTDNLGYSTNGGAPPIPQDPRIVAFDQIWHNTDKNPDTLNTNHDEIYFWHSVRN